MTALQDAEHETDAHGDDVYVVRHAAGDVVLRIVQDHDCASPLSQDAGDFLPRLAMIGRTDYVGTADDVPYEMELDCPHCDGTGWVVQGHDQGEPHAMPDENGEVPCVPCVNSGQIEADDVDQYLWFARGALASLEITVGGRDAQCAVIYLTAEEVKGAGMPGDKLDEVLRGYASEYHKWEEGDRWGYVCDGPCSDDSCWGFIGREYVEREASEALKWAISCADKELDEASYWLARGIETVAA